MTMNSIGLKESRRRLSRRFRAAAAGKRLRRGLTIGAGVALLVVVASVVTLTALRVERGKVESSVTNDEGISAPEAKARGVFAAPGDGTVHFTSTRRSPSTGTIVMQVRIVNAGDVEAKYTVTLFSPTNELNGQMATVTVPGGKTKVLQLSADTRNLASGRYEVSASLRSSLHSFDLSTDTTTIEIP